jgi:hypothetical protein
MTRKSLGGAVLALGAALVVAVATLTPGVRFSNRLTPDKDGRTLVATLTPRVGWTGPYQWRATLNDTVRVDSILPDSAGGLTDTVWTPYPTCAVYRVTVRPVGAPDSLTRMERLCRNATATELAFADSFPAVVLRDSLGGFSGTLTIGDRRPLCALARNRYTGQVVIVLPPLSDSATGAAEAACEAARVAYTGAVRL